MTNRAARKTADVFSSSESLVPIVPMRTNGQLNKLSVSDRVAHDWYRFVLSFPPHLVKQYLEEFKATSLQTVLDPFCGTGTTVVECKKNGISSIGIEANDFAHFACSTKVSWEIEPQELLLVAAKIAKETAVRYARDGVADVVALTEVNVDSLPLQALPADLEGLLLKNSVSALPMHKVLILQKFIDKYKGRPFYSHLNLALCKAVTFTISNLNFGPEIGVGKLKHDSPVVSVWLDQVKLMAEDLVGLRDKKNVRSTVYHADSRVAFGRIEPESIDVVITSPPYPNEKDYTRTTRLESVLLGFVKTKEDLRALKRTLVRSNTRGVYKGDDDDQWVVNNAEVQRIALAIENRRLELGKTSGFEKLYAKVTKLYFGGMAKHLADMRVVLKPGAKLAYVVGDQASYLRIMIRTGKILGEIAESLGYEVLRIDLFRTRLATATREQLREEVLVLRWPGYK